MPFTRECEPHLSSHRDVESAFQKPIGGRLERLSVWSASKSASSHCRSRSGSMAAAWALSRRMVKAGMLSRVLGASGEALTCRANLMRQS